MDYIERFKMKEKPYNFDIIKMTNEFDFNTFIEKGKSNNKNNAVLIITNKQYVTSYTDNYGEGYHSIALIRMLKEILGGGLISNNKEANQYNKDYKNYIHARMSFENNSGSILFFGLENLNKENYNIFLKFYDDWNETLNHLCKNNKLYIGFMDEKSKSFISSDSLDKLLIYLKKHLDKDKKIVNVEENIISKSSNIKQKKR